MLRVAARLFWRLWLGQLVIVLVALLAGGAGFWTAVGTTAALTFFTTWMCARLSVSYEDIESDVDRMRSDLASRGEQLKREREEHATLMAAITDAILAVDREGGLLFFNTRFALHFGDKGFAARKPRLGEIFRLPELLDAFRLTMEQGIPRSIGVELHAHDEHSARDFQVSLAPLRHSGGECYGAIGIFHDVSELKRAERIRIEFVANVSHELRTPLTAIKGYADTLRQDIAEGRGDSVAKFVDVIARNSDRLMALIGDLLDLSALESGPEQGKLQKRLIDPTELTVRVIAQLGPRSREKGQHIDFDPAPVGARSLLGDPDRVEQVLINLLENAIKYVPAGGRISVRWEGRAEGMFLHVRDNGPGVPPEHQPRLFERFYRVDRSRSREEGGTGLGLAIVKHILQQHGGAVWVMSEPGKGAEFVCRFPDV